MTRTGWHCLTCNRYFQTEESEPPPARCRYCDAEAVRRIEHPDRTPVTDITTGSVVACDLVGEAEGYVVGEVVEIRGDRLLVRATDGTGTYSVPADRVVNVRSSGESCGPSR